MFTAYASNPTPSVDLSALHAEAVAKHPCICCGAPVGEPCTFLAVPCLTRTFEVIWPRNQEAK